MWSKHRLILIILGVLFHLFYLWSIFDIYFVSPLVHGMKHYPSAPNAPAKRLFLIVGDGLRADTTFEKINYPNMRDSQYLAPFIRSIALNNGTWGISHTRMPTESRPGHVAMIAGFYEDVSAVTKGWKENPVDFDSVFNQSTHTYSFGSPDILPMFKEGASGPNKVDAWMYGHEFEDFTQSSIELDAYVFRNLYQLFDNSTKNASLNKEIHQNGNVFFLHLLGCDTAGHTARPYSKEYYDNVKYIDTQISQLVSRVRDFFKDDDTAFVFTADHGMSAFGSHGDGHPNNTRTPLVAWGSGVSGPVVNKHPELALSDSYTGSWELHSVERHDVNQADITALMSYLIGTNFPSNSVGELPLPYLDASDDIKLHSLYNNAREILEQYIAKEKEVIGSQFVYKEYYKFAKKHYTEYLKEIEALIANAEDSLETIKLTEELMKVTLEGLNYLTTYNWRFIRTIVTLGFIGWIVYSFIIFLRLFILSKRYEDGISKSTFTIFTVLSMLLNYILYYQRSPFNFYMYLLFPIIFWSRIFSERKILIDGVKEFLKGLSVFKKTIILLSILGFYEGIVYGFSQRWVFTLIFIILAFYPITCGIYNTKTNLLWIYTSVCLSIFTLLDAVKIENLNQILVSGMLILVSASYGLYSVRNLVNDYTFCVIGMQISLVVVMLLITNEIVISLQLKEGLPFDKQIAAWGTFIISLIFFPFLHYIKPCNNYKVRMLIIYVTFAPAFIILTISFETFFYFFFSMYLFQWIEIETKIMQLTSKSNASHVNYLQLLRVSVIGFFLLQIAFFGTGNVASISSFSLDSVFRLMPIFNPFSMGALLMLKLLVPYILLSAALGILNLKLHIRDYTISSLIISTSDILSLNFFYLLKTEGSWLDIGVTISNYCLAILSSLFMIIVEIISHYLLKHVEIPKNEAISNVIEKTVSGDNKKKKKKNNSKKTTKGD
ncbi:probable GPI ethanolamine phosphate transferase 1 [Saccharomycodes ludwigii]|uniref:GPI ethanolamine phosphate transferase 1 n=1 Tax=Saccharomycodes ludwigii TaxID=36035 RepID=A0A376B9A3_9ASCO|nr:probable GPI ethanolamine phosphate transferase 1 [Saccharomycodes ludwigii]